MCMHVCMCVCMHAIDLEVVNQLLIITKKVYALVPLGKELTYNCLSLSSVQAAKCQFRPSSKDEETW